MSAFEFFFSFYGLLLGLSVAELVGGFARVLHRRRAVRFGWLTPLLAVFVAVDIVTFWNQAWVLSALRPRSGVIHGRLSHAALAPPGEAFRTMSVRRRLTEPL